MPYNNTPIAPSGEITGTVALPLARVKKIILADDDISACSTNAAFVITVATEMFLQHMVEQSFNIVKSERKPRRNIQYKDVASAVARVENLEFLTDVVPKTMTFKQLKQKQAKEAANLAPHTNGASSKGQGTLDTHLGSGVREAQATNGASHDDAMDVDDGEDDEEGTDDPADEEGESEATQSPEPVSSKPGEDREMESEGS